MLIYVLINKLCAYYVTLVPLCPHYTSQLCTIMCIMYMQMYMGGAHRQHRRVRGAGQVGILRHCFVVLRSTHGHHMGQFDGAEAIGALGFDRLSQQESRFGNFDALFWASRQLILRVWGFLRDS